jgi:hypothetical protein
MIFRSLDENDDWNWGSSLASFGSEDKAIIDNLVTHLRTINGENIGNEAFGIDWFSILGQSRISGGMLSRIKSYIASLYGVVAVHNVDVERTANRRLLLRVTIDTIYSKTRSLGVRIL